jgi:hypothetical protein
LLRPERNWTRDIQQKRKREKTCKVAAIARRTLVYVFKLEGKISVARLAEKGPVAMVPHLLSMMKYRSCKQATGSIPGRVITWRVRCFFLSLRLSPEKSNQKYLVTNCCNLQHGEDS